MSLVRGEEGFEVVIRLPGPLQQGKDSSRSALHTLCAALQCCLEHPAGLWSRLQH